MSLVCFGSVMYDMYCDEVFSWFLLIVFKLLEIKSVWEYVKDS